MEVVPDTGLDRPRGLSVHYKEHVWLGEEDSVKSEEEGELERRREERLRREEGLAEAEAAAEDGGHGRVSVDRATPGRAREAPAMPWKEERGEAISSTLLSPPRASPSPSSSSTSPIASL